MNLIEDVIFFVMQTDATKTIRAASTMNEECARCAVVAIAGKRNAVTLDAIRTFITELGIETVNAIETIFALIEDMPVCAILVAHIATNEIAVAAGKGHRAVIRIFALCVDYGHSGNRVMQ